MSSKYDVLGAYLESQPFSTVPMKFSEIEHIVGFPLPPVAKSARAWWSNNSSNNVMTKVWTKAGFKSEQVDMVAERLVFRRVGKAPSPPASSPPPGAASGGAGAGRLFGCLKGTVLVAADFDLAAPIEADWGGAGT